MTLAGVLALREVLLKVQTSRFGEIEVDNADVITLPEGLVGFPELARYVLLDHDSDSPFKWLQSLDDGTMAFVVISPLTFRPDYTVEVTEEEIAILKLQSPDDAVISVIVTIPSDPQKNEREFEGAPRLQFEEQNWKTGDCEGSSVPN